MLGDNGALVVLSVEYKCYNITISMFTAVFRERLLTYRYAVLGS